MKNEENGLVTWQRAIGGTLVLTMAILGGCSEESSEAGTRPNEGAAPSDTASQPGPANPGAGSTTGVVAASDTRSLEDRIAAGRSAYNANCTACHSMNPAQDGALGPAVAGASEELLYARVMRGEYPPNYAPKRNSRVMVPLPHLERQIPVLADYLGSLE